MFCRSKLLEKSDSSPSRELNIFEKRRGKKLGVHSSRLRNAKKDVAKLELVMLRKAGELERALVEDNCGYDVCQLVFCRFAVSNARKIMIKGKVRFVYLQFCHVFEFSVDVSLLRVV